MVTHCVTSCLSRHVQTAALIIEKARLCFLKTTHLKEEAKWQYSAQYKRDAFRIEPSNRNQYRSVAFLSGRHTSPSRKNDEL
tara:strand:- start:3505 stop:3750 length:246 start_codon:yes stop_codon:yes gene_type:complete